MIKYFDFVLCQTLFENTIKLYHAPRFSGLKKGDMVTVETLDGEQMAKVIACSTIGDNEKTTIDLIMEATKSPEELPKVLKKMTFREFEEDEDEQSEN
jgi:hypothetical protein